MIGQNICPICGKASRYYMGVPRRDKLCGKHADLLKSGGIKCIGNGKFVSNEGLSLNRECNLNEQTNKSHIGCTYRCICCGSELIYTSSFCRSCFDLYKNKKIFISIDKCKDFVLLDETYEGNLKCKDGHIVKSEKERFIDDYLFNHSIRHCYEPTLPISLNESLHPDFYLPKFKKKESDIVDNVFIEYFGFDEDFHKYLDRKKYKLERYKSMNLTVICINKKETLDFKGTLDKKLKFFEWYKITA